MKTLDRLTPILYETTPFWLKKLFAQRYIAGETMGSIATLAQHLHRLGFEVITDVLGGHSVTDEDRDSYFSSNVELMDRLDDLDGTATTELAIKPSAMGMRLEPDEHLDQAAAREVQRLVTKANRTRSDLVGVTNPPPPRFVWLDMEELRLVDRTIALYEQLQAAFPDTGIAIQSYLKNRTNGDLERVLKLHNAYIRLVNGIYVNDDPKEIETDPGVQNLLFYEALEKIILAIKNEGPEDNKRVDIATHKTQRIRGALQLLKKYDLLGHKYKYAFALLYGVRPELARDLKDTGHRVKIYLPGGPLWEPYVSRRAVEHPRFIRQAALLAVRELTRGQGIQPRYN